MMKNNNILFAILGIILFAILAFVFVSQKAEIPPENITESEISNFEECIAAGNPVMESYPRQCRDGDRTFVEKIGNELSKVELIRIDYPRPNQTINSPFTVKGEARGTWFFEASFPVELINRDGHIIAQGIATAQGEWMTEEFVPFETVLEFDMQEAHNSKGTLILKKDNPSGLPENDDSLKVPVIIGNVSSES
ncbi:MAG: Gmad2 immunoglobulin-like domain-containing protein [bacterium]|nr:Gmad2 immunoglobulin-like domain-containing protein [bacterium]